MFKNKKVFLLAIHEEKVIKLFNLTHGEQDEELV